VAKPLVHKSARKYWAEALGTFWLVFAGVATILFNPTTGNLGIALAFGLTVLTGVYALGRISGGHFNPAVTVGTVAGGRMPADEAVLYILAQLIGGILGALALFAIASGKAGFAPGGFGSTGFASHSQGNYSMIAAGAAELIATFFFVLVILGATARKAHHSLAPLAIGLALTLVHLAIIGVSGSSVNPARSTATAVVALIGGTNWPVMELWLYWLAPIVGGALAGWAYKEIFADE
jgi:aquaporin Z